MTESDRKYYERQAIQDAKRKLALSKARHRANIAAEWFKTNQLTVETQPAFNYLMKQADKEFDRLQSLETNKEVSK